MSEQDSTAEELLREETRVRLGELRRVMLRLHKTLLEDERAAYERVHGRVGGGELLQLVINHEQFAWLHAISELVVQIDELLDMKEPAADSDGQALIAELRALLNRSEPSGEFEQKYYAALQREPAAVLEHAELQRLLAGAG